MQLALGKSEEDEPKENLHLISDVRSPYYSKHLHTVNIRWHLTDFCYPLLLT